MNFIIKQYPFGIRPAVNKPTPAILEHLGEDGIRKLVSRHYDLLKESPIGHLFAQESSEFELQKQHSADFFIQICGGTNYYNQHRGKPMMVNRHSSFKIDQEARTIWLQCYQQALSELQTTPTHLVQSFWNYIEVFSVWMINTPSETKHTFDTEEKINL